MIKFYFVLRKKPEISKEEFHQYWKTTHAEIVRKLPGLVKYVQHHVITIPRPEYAQGEDPVDGIVETWWESEQALAAVKDSPELAAVVADEPNFIKHDDHYIQSLMVTESVDILKDRPA